MLADSHLLLQSRKAENRFSEGKIVPRFVLPEQVACHPLWHLCGISLFLVLVSLHRRASSSGVLVLVLWNLTGVILHEAAHLVVGLLLQARPTGISLLPHRDGNGWRLGSVGFRRITAFNAVPVALAPLSLIGVAYWLARNWFTWQAPSLPATLGLYGCVFILLYNALPSRQDLRVACSWRSLLLYVPLAAALVFYFLRPLIG
jgi:hypothetical protein